MDERSRVLMATFLGAVVGGVWGWLYMTENGRRVRDQIEPKLDDFMNEVTRVRGTVEKARTAANEGWRSLNDIAGQRTGPLVGIRGTRTMGDLADHQRRLVIMAVVSVLEALLLIGIGIGGFMVYRRVMQLVTDLEARQIAPLREKVDAILGDVKAVTARVNSRDRARRPRDSRHDRPRGRHRRAREELGDGQGEQRGRGRARRARRDRVAAADGSQAEAARHGRGTALTAGSDGRTRSTGGCMAYEYDRFEREDGGGSFLMGLLAGTVLGAGLGMLFAPKAGSELRNQISEQAGRCGRRRTTPIAGVGEGQPDGRSRPRGLRSRPRRAAASTLARQGGSSDRRQRRQRHDERGRRRHRHRRSATAPAAMAPIAARSDGACEQRQLSAARLIADACRSCPASMTERQAETIANS